MANLDLPSLILGINECGIPTTCKESHLPYRDEGLDHQSRKRADMMTLNPHLNFTSTTRLVMDVTIGHSYTTHHFKPNGIQTMESTKRHKYSTAGFNGPSPPKENPVSAHTARAPAGPPLPSGGRGGYSL
jgi:hypothetical protein